MPPLHSRAFYFKSVFCSVLALGLDLGTGFGSGLWLQPATSMGGLALTGGAGKASTIVLVLATVATV
jgi:hypothetical protein